MAKDVTNSEEGHSDETIYFWWKCVEKSWKWVAIRLVNTANELSKRVQDEFTQRMSGFTCSSKIGKYMVI